MSLILLLNALTSKGDNSQKIRNELKRIHAKLSVQWHNTVFYNSTQAANKFVVFYLFDNVSFLQV